MWARLALSARLALALGASICVAALPAGARASGNLIVDGDGAGGTCSDDWNAVTTVPGWTVLAGNPAIDCAGIALMNTPHARSAGSAFIAGGPYGDAALTQTADLSSAAAAIDAGGVTFELSGWLGGWAEYAGQAVLTVTFLDASGIPLGQPAVLSGVTAAVRHDQSGFVDRRTGGAVPAGARQARVLLQFVDTGGTYNDGFADMLSLVLSTEVTRPVLTPPPSAVPAVDHVFLIMMENTDFGQVIGDRQNAPFINRLAASGTLLTNSSGVYHPSDENYLAIAGGNTFVQGAIYFPRIHVDARNIADELEAAGKTWRAYEQGMGVPCNHQDDYDPYYEPDDAPFINFDDIRHDHRRCEAHLSDTTQLAPDLRSAAGTPAFCWIAADDYFDGEASGNGSPKSLRVQDHWLRRTLAPIFASPAWITQRSLLVLTWDESSTYGTNHIATMLYGSQGLVRSGVQSMTSYDHYSTGRTVELALGLAPLTANDAYAQPINDAFAGAAMPQPVPAVPPAAVGQVVGPSVRRTGLDKPIGR